MAFAGPWFHKLTASYYLPRRVEARYISPHWPIPVEMYLMIGRWAFAIELTCLGECLVSLGFILMMSVLMPMLEADSICDSEEKENLLFH